MKTSKKFFNLIMFAVFCSSFGTLFANADSSVSGNLATGFSFTDIVKEAAKTLTGSVDATVTPASDIESVATETEDTTVDNTADEDKNACEHLDSTVINVLSLESSSADTRQKIDNVEATIDDESIFRDSILGSIKDFLGLQKNDKKVFGQMKQQITDARSYYDKVDLKVASTSEFLDANYCENVKLETAAKLDTDTKNMVVNEAAYRKTLADSLKEKMKILQESVKSAQK